MRSIFKTKKSLFLGASLLLTGCGGGWEQHMQSVLPEPEPAFAKKEIVVAQGRMVHEVEYSGQMTKLSADHAAGLDDFLDNALRDDRNALVLVEQPDKGAPRLMRERAANLLKSLHAAGRRTDVLAVENGRADTLRVAVDHLTAVAPNCPDWNFHKYDTYSAQPYPNFGCADRTNLAAMISNPNDLVVGNVPSPWSGAAAVNGEARYRTGGVLPPVGTEVATGGSSVTNTGGGQ